MPNFNIKDPHVAKYGREGVVTLAANVAIPEGYYYAVSFLDEGGLTVDFADEEAPLWTGTRTVTFPKGYTLFTDLRVPAACAARINVPIVLYRYR